MLPSAGLCWLPAAPHDTHLLKNQTTQLEHIRKCSMHTAVRLFLYLNRRSCSDFREIWSETLALKPHSQTSSCTNATKALLVNTEETMLLCAHFDPVFKVGLYLTLYFFYILFIWFKGRRKPSLVPASTLLSIKREVRLDASVNFFLTSPDTFQWQTRTNNCSEMNRAHSNVHGKQTLVWWCFLQLHKIH